MRTLISVLATFLLSFPASSSSTPKTDSQNITMKEYWTRDVGYMEINQIAINQYTHDFEITVQEGDNLTRIAHRINHLRQNSRYPGRSKVTAMDIYEWSNKLGGDKIFNPNLIFPGQTLRYKISHIP